MEIWYGILQLVQIILGNGIMMGNMVKFEKELKCVQDVRWNMAFQSGQVKLSTSS